MRVLISNDDGASAPGIAALIEAAGLAFDAEITVVAPERKWTAASHSLSFDRDLTLTRTGLRSYTCSGTPADCVVAAMSAPMEGMSRPDLVLAGINDKRNVAEDLAYSGTIAIAREATFWGVPAISLARDFWGIDRASELAAIAALLAYLWRCRDAWAIERRWLNVNLPAALPAPLRQAHLGRDKIASACDLVRANPDCVVYRIRRGRPSSAAAGDENFVLQSGAIAIAWHDWASARELPERLVDDFNAGDSSLASLRRT